MQGFVRGPRSPSRHSRAFVHRHTGPLGTTAHRHPKHSHRPTASQTATYPPTHSLTSFTTMPLRDISWPQIGPRIGAPVRETPGGALLVQASTGVFGGLPSSRCVPTAPSQPPPARLKRLRREEREGLDPGLGWGPTTSYVPVARQSRADNAPLGAEAEAETKAGFSSVGSHSVCTCVGLCTREGSAGSLASRHRRLSGWFAEIHLVGLQKYTGGIRQRSARGGSA